MVDIPVRNIYYLLSYAWDKLEERDLVNVDAQSFKDLPNLFAKVLANGLRYLFKRGLDRDYVIEEGEYRGIKGKLLFTPSLKRNIFISGRSICSFDEFTHDVLHNQILKATLFQLLQSGKLEDEIRQELIPLYQKFHNVTEIKLARKHFSQVVLHRNNRFYKFLLDVALVIFDNLLFDQSSNTWKFKDFVRDESQMATLFEKFIFNFYKRELSKEYSVSVEIIKWQAQAIGSSSLDYLPVMRTDISLTNNTRKIIIDAKYYREAMVTRFDREKFRSQHFYQMFAYMSNLEAVQHADKIIEGVLFYPTVEKSFVQSYKVKDYKLSLRTLDLRAKWQEIEEELLQI